MKHILFTIAGLLLTAFLFSQVPQAINYQAVVRTQAGEVIANTSVGLKIEIVAGDQNQVLYTETHEVTTNAFGLINIQIGTGNTTDNFNAIDWNIADCKVHVSYDENNSGSYALVGISPLASVPYALVAEDTRNKQQISIDGNQITLTDGGSITLPEDNVDDADADPTNEIQTITLTGNTLTLSDGGSVELPGGFSGDYNDLTNTPELATVATTGDYADLANKPTLAGDVSGNIETNTVEKIQGRTITANNPADGQVLKWSEADQAWQLADDQLGAPGSTDGVVNSVNITGTDTKTLTLNRSNSLGSLVASFNDQKDDADANPTNEIQDLNLTGNILTITNNGAATEIDLSVFMDNTDNQNISLVGNTLTLANGGTVDLTPYLDNSDAQTLSLTGTTLTISGGNNVNLSVLQDGTGTDDQQLSLSGNTLTLENGGTVSLASYLDNTDDQNLVLTGDVLSIENGIGSVNLSNYLDDADADPANELQTLALSGTELTISGKNTIDLAGLNTDDQTLGLTGNTLTLVDGGSVDLTPFLDDTDEQTLLLSGSSLSIANGNTVDLSGLGGGGSDDQTLSLTGTTLAIEDGNSVNLASINTDAQTLSLTGTTLAISGGNNVNLSAIQDGTGTDDQTIDVLSLSGTTLNISLEGDGQATKALNLSALQDGTGTDDQQLTFSPATGLLDIENGNSVDLSGYKQDLSLSGTTLSLTGDVSSVNLSVLQDGTGTDDQTIDILSLSGTTLNISLEGDGQATKTLDLSTLQDGIGTDDQQLSLSGNTLSLENGGSISLAAYVNTDAQDLTLSGSTLSLTGDATSVDLSSLQGAFGTSSNVTSNSSGAYATDDFVFGSPSLNYSNVSTQAERFFFDNSKSAFRAGKDNSTAWDEANIGEYSFAGGFGSKASGSGSTAFGRGTSAGGTNSFAVGYTSNASGDQAFASGYSSIASGDYATSMGLSTEASGMYSMAVGRSSQASANYAFAVGYTAVASAEGAVAIGNWNDATGAGSLAMGYSTESNGSNSVSIGYMSNSNGNFSMALGNNNTISISETNSFAFGNNIEIDAGSHTIAIGNNIRGYYNGQVIMADNSTTTKFWRGIDNSFAARFNGGYYLYSNTAESTGVYMNSGDNSWSSISDSTKKENFKPVDGEMFLDKISNFNLTSWNYKGQDKTKFRHYGPMAQDFYAAFGNDGIGTVGCDTLLATADFMGVNFIAIQALEKRTRELKETQAQLQAKIEEVNALKAKIDEIDVLKAEMDRIKQIFETRAQK